MIVSVCIPTYTRLHFLKQAVQSALDQNYAGIEVCISQDPLNSGPEPNIQAWCERKSKTDTRIIYHLNSERLGLANNWNKLVDIASGEYLIIIGDDDLLKEGFLNTITALIKKTNADVVFSNQEFMNDNGEVMAATTEYLNKLYKRNELKSGLLIDPLTAIFNNSIPMSASLIKKDALKKYRFDKELNTPEFEVFLKLALEEKQFAYTEKKLAAYRIHNNSATSSGLSIDKLLKKIIPIQVPEKYEGMKYNFISAKIISAINFSLKRQDKIIATYLLHSKYYPKNKKLLKLIQTILLRTPFWINKRLYKFYKTV